MIKWKEFLDGIDEIAAFILIVAGIAYSFTTDFQNGVTMVGIGSSYLFGKSVPKK